MVGAAVVVATVVDVSEGAVVAAAGIVVDVLANKVVVGESVSSDDVVVSVEHDATHDRHREDDKSSQPSASPPSHPSVHPSAFCLLQMHATARSMKQTVRRVSVF